MATKSEHLLFSAKILLKYLRNVTFLTFFHEKNIEYFNLEFYFIDWDLKINRRGHRDVPTTASKTGYFLGKISSTYTSLHPRQKG